MQLFIKTFWLIWNFWFKLPDKIRFLFVGGFNACVQYGLYVLFLWLSDGHRYQMALVASWTISSFSSFATQKIFVFCTKGTYKDWIKEYVKCFGVWITSYILNAIVLDLLVKIANMNPYGAQILAIVCTTISSYILMKYFAFKK